MPPVSLTTVTWRLVLRPKVPIDEAAGGAVKVTVPADAEVASILMLIEGLLASEVAAVSVTLTLAEDAYAQLSGTPPLL